MQWKYWPTDTAADRVRKYGKARSTLGAARGWEPWLRWEDRMVENLVEHGRRSVKELAARLQRTENAILCRIEKRYGKVTRDEHNNCYVVHPQSHQEPKMPFKQTRETDFEIMLRTEKAIIKMRSLLHPLDAQRWAYRVTEAEWNAVCRELEASARRWGGHPEFHPVRITLAGVELVMREDFPAPSTPMPDYGISG